MENRLRNLSVLVDEYQTHILDLVRFSCGSLTKEATEALLTKIFIAIFKGLKKGDSPLPMHMFIYSCAIKTILKSKTLPPKAVPSVRVIDEDVNIQEFEPSNFKDIDVTRALGSIRPGNRIILCLNIRHKLSVDEIATLFSVTPGTILTRLHKSRIKIAKHEIKQSSPDAKRSPAKDTRECFFTRNMEPSYRMGLLAKEDSSRVSRHVSKCGSCRNFYDWHEKIDSLIEKTQKPVMDSQINKNVFFQLEKAALTRNVFHQLKHNWMIKVPAIMVVLVFIVLAAVSYHPSYGRRVQRQNSEQVIQTQATAPIEKRIVYRLTTRTTHRKTVGRKINELLSSIGARTATEGKPVMDDTGVMTHFQFLVNKKDLESTLKAINSFDKFEMLEEEDSTPPQTTEDIRVEIWVKRKNAE